MRIREPRESWVVFLFLWAAGFGGIPAFMIVSFAADDVAVPMLLWLFPAIAGAVVVGGLRRFRRSGFVLTEGGIEGAHEAETERVPWSAVERIEWRHAAPTSSVRVNGRPLPSGPALFAVGHGGRNWRLMQSCATREAQQRRINERMAQAVATGSLPVAFDPDVTADTGPAEPATSDADGSWQDTEVRRWSSSGVGEEPPTAGSSLDDDPPVWPTG